MNPTPAAVLKVFALILSRRWIKQWQKTHAPARAKKKSGARAGPAPPAAKKPNTPQGFYERIFSPQVTLWYLIFQRLMADHTLAAVVRDLRRGGANRLGRHGDKKLSDRHRSRSTSGYSAARQRMPVALFQDALQHLGDGLRRWVGWGQGPSAQAPAPSQRSRQLLEGSTLCVLVNRNLARAYPPASNGFCVTDWSQIRIVVGFCARSGAVLSATEGPATSSEQSLSWSLLEQAPRFTVWIGDRNFGVWRVVSKAAHQDQDVVVRLTRARARKLAGGRPLRSGEDRAVSWQPSRLDHGAPGVPRQGIQGRLIYVRIRRQGKSIDLFLFTTLPAADYPVALLVQWYGQRWQAEVHFRSVKTHLKMEQLHVVSADRARKEFYAGLLAYSLVRAVMWGGGAGLEEKVKAISFSQARRVLVDWLQDWGRGLLKGHAHDLIDTLLDEVAGELLPRRRRKRRSEVRRVRCRAQKFPTLQGSRALARRKARHQASMATLSQAKTQ